MSDRSLPLLELRMHASGDARIHLALIDTGRCPGRREKAAKLSNMPCKRLDHDRAILLNNKAQAITGGLRNVHINRRGRVITATDTLLTTRQVGPCVWRRVPRRSGGAVARANSTMSVEVARRGTGVTRRVNGFPKDFGTSGWTRSRLR